MSAKIRTDLLFLALVCIFGICIRFDFLLAGNFIIDSDEAIVGLMAKHVLEGGAIPTFYYGQHYMGSLEPLLVSASFAIFGISNLAMQLVPLLFSVALILVIYLIGSEISGRFVARLSAAFCALPPATLVVWSSKARGGFIEVVFLGAIALLLTMRWLKEETPKPTGTVWIGLVLGLGWWVNNQILYFMLPIGMFMALRLVRNRSGSFLPIFARHAISGLVAFIVGGAPFWVYQCTHDFASFGMFGGATFKEAIVHVSGLFDTALPILLGAKQSWQVRDVFPGASIVYWGVYGSLLGIVLYWRRRELFDVAVARLDQRRPIEILFFFILASCAVFALSTFGWLVQAPRYLLPLYVGIFPIAALGIDRLRKVSPIGAGLMVLAVLSLSTYSSYGGGRALPGEPVVYNGERVSKDHSELIDWLIEQKVRWVRTNYWIGYRLAFESGERVRFKVVHEPRTDRIPRYRHESKGIPCMSMPLVLVPSQAELSRKAMRKLGFQFSEVQKSGYVVLYDIYSQFPDTESVPSTELSVSASVNSESAHSAVDGSLETRWGTAEHQRPGEEITIRFSAQTKLVGFDYSEGNWQSDFPRALRITGLDSSGTVRTLLTPEEYAAIRYYIQEEGEWRFYFPEIELTQVTLTQLGRHPIFDWSIAELRFLKPKASDQP